MMNIKKFMIMGIVSLTLLVGCGTQERASGAAEKAASENVQTQEILAATAEASESPAISESPSPSPSVDPAVAKQETAKEQIEALAGLMGKKAEEVDAVLGKPANVQNLEDTDILLVRYYKIEYLDEIAKVEVVFNDTEQVVNYISFVILQANDINESKETIAATLTEAYGESSIERFVDVSGRKNRNWHDDNLIYDLRYYENNLSLDIYPIDK